MESVSTAERHAHLSRRRASRSDRSFGLPRSRSLPSSEPAARERWRRSTLHSSLDEQSWGVWPKRYPLVVPLLYLEPESRIQIRKRVRFASSFLATSVPRC